MSDERLDDVVDALRVELDAEIARERRLVTPDFAAVVAAAHARAPELIDEAAVREAGELAPIVELGAELERRGGDAGGELSDAELDAWIADARELAEGDVAARRLAGVPALPDIPVVAPPRRRWVVAVAVAAVLAGLGVAIPRLLDAFVDGNYREASTPNQAEYQGAGASEGEGVRLLPEPSMTEPISQQAIPHDQPPPPTVEHVGGDAPAPRAKPDARKRTRDRIATLDAEAQALWAQGDLAGAERRFREIIEIAGASQRRYADLAYGDLFTLARQRKDDAAELALWREYIERFPRGRFVDDARAGLCRRGPAGEREACWQAYLDDFPHGVHTRAASRALGLDGLDSESP